MPQSQCKGSAQTIDVPLPPNFEKDFDDVYFRPTGSQDIHINNQDRLRVKLQMQHHKQENTMRRQQEEIGSGYDLEEIFNMLNTGSPNSPTYKGNSADIYRTASKNKKRSFKIMQDALFKKGK